MGNLHGVIPIVGNPSPLYRVQLRHMLKEHFNLEELKTLCFDLGVEFNDLGGEGLSAKIRELIVHVMKQSRLDDLLMLAAANSPKANWPSPGQTIFQCPYRGLEAFLEIDAPNFFGREIFSQKLHSAVQQKELIAVIGPSGSGKSSVVFAGLLPRLLHQNGWNIAQLRPGKQPFHSLVTGLIPLLDPKISSAELLEATPKLVEDLQSGQMQLANVIDLLRQKQPDTKQCLIIIDQFEELYTMCDEPEIRCRFLDVLLAVTEQKGKPTLPTKIVLTLRADFLSQALMYRPFADALQDNDMKLGPMNKEELLRAIAQPAENAGVHFEAGLVDRIIEDAMPGGRKQIEPGNLPLLEFALTLLWEWQANGRLTHVSYETIGQVKGALARHADAVYEALSDAEQKKVQHILLQMIHPGTGSEDTRRLATKEEIGESEWGVVQRLADERLVVTDMDEAAHETVELVHEALLQHWKPLADWIESDRTFRTWQERLRAAMHEWIETGRDEGALLRGVPLSDAEGWLRERRDDLGRMEKAFIRYSIKRRDTQKTKRERERQRELEQARQLAELNRRLAKAGPRIFIPFLLLALLVGVAGFYISTSQVTSTLNERFTNQLLDAKRVVTNGINESEYSRLETIHTVASKLSVAQTLANADTEMLAQLVRPIISNSDNHAIKLVNMEGTEIYGWRQLPSQGQSKGIESYGNELSHIQDIQMVLDGYHETLGKDEIGDKRVGLRDSEEGLIFYTVGPVYLNTDRVGAVLVGTDANHLASELTTEAFARVTLYDTQGKAIAATLSGDLDVLGESVNLYKEVVSSGETEVPMRSKVVRGQNYLLAFEEWSIYSQPLGMFSVALPQDFIVETMATSRNLFTVISILATLSVIALGFVIVQRIIRPIRELVRISRVER